MSAAVVVIISPAAVTATATLVPVIAAGAVCYAALRQLREDHRRVKDEFEARSQEALRIRQAQAEKQAAAERMAMVLTDYARIPAVQRTTSDFLVGRVQGLLSRLPAAGPDGDVLGDECRQLLAAIQAQPGEASGHLKAYVQLAERVSATLAAAQQTPGYARALLGEIEALRIDINSPLLIDPANEKLRDDLMSQLRALVELARQQPAMVGQSLLLLRQRVNRELQARSEWLESRVREADALQTMVEDTMAALHAVSQQQEMPHYQQQANEALQRLQELLSGGGLNNAPALHALAKEAHELFTTCERELTVACQAQYVNDQLTDILLSMGYRVDQLPPGEEQHRTLLARVDDQIGVEFHLNGERMGAQMVALSEASAAAGPEFEERVCQIMDQVIAALNERQCGAQERFRSALTPGEALRVVQVEEKQAQITAATPLARRVE